ncbi:MAG: GNAT family N-acetyltransferase [Clostridia bacterium]|nr:GNAT family N-acetyltransferase [Clostridia bacterium]
MSALEGRTGRAFESANGTAALVAARGFVFLGGQAREWFFREAAACLSPGFLTFIGSPSWLGIARRWGAQAPMTRWRMETPDRFNVGFLRRLAVPMSGFILKTGDEQVYADCLKDAWSEDLAAFYPDGAAMARDGLTVTAYRGKELVAGCGVYARTETTAEIEIDTRIDMRRQGLAACCAAAFLLHCVDQGVTPHWDAMTPISRNLALKLGFVRPRPYFVVCREEKNETNR